MASYERCKLRRLNAQCLGFYLAALVLLGACSTRHSGPCDSTKQAPDTDNPPLYPGAQQVEKGLSHRSTNIPTTTFLTDAPSEEVMQFYKDTLSNDGWLQRDAQIEPNELYFNWENCCSYTWLLVNVTTTNTGQAKVAIEHPIIGYCTD